MSAISMGLILAMLSGSLASWILLNHISKNSLYLLCHHQIRCVNCFRIHLSCEGRVLGIRYMSLRCYYT
ncbi:hypothetical protein F8M41_007421 [Gigaspora margarita]|uniref:Secreted protein n=1 Tax=Gigaspora margarita TaxID=4874 RepID=A0A8H3X5Q7_GIGMA|nr:hypothetical protein F8M41_007421 [Gigaspora margarita]